MMIQRKCKTPNESTLKEKQTFGTLWTEQEASCFFSFCLMWDFQRNFVPFKGTRSRLKNKKRCKQNWGFFFKREKMRKRGTKKTETKKAHIPRKPTTQDMVK